ncbi:hypothetical protein Tco_1498938 [Tanacetum coccineum]
MVNHMNRITYGFTDDEESLFEISVTLPKFIKWNFTIIKTILLKTLNIPPPDRNSLPEIEEKQLLPLLLLLMIQNLLRLLKMRKCQRKRRLNTSWLYFFTLRLRKIYKLPKPNNLRTSSNTSRANQDNSPRINRGTGYDNQRAVNVVGARENVGTPVVQKSGIQCYNCKEYGHVSRECQKPKRVKDAAYHKEKMLLCKQEEAGVQLNAEQADWKDDTDDESDDQELEAHYMYMAQLQEVTPDQVDNSGPIFDERPCHKDDQDETDDLDQERDLLASLIQK